MGKGYYKMERKANGKIREIRDEKVLLELPLPVAEVLEGIPQAVKGFSQDLGLMVISAAMGSECKKIAGQKHSKNPSPEHQNTINPIELFFGYEDDHRKGEALERR